MSGDPDIKIRGLATLGSATEGKLSFFHNPRYLADLRNTRASAVIVHPDYRDQCPSAVLLSTSPYVTFARASKLFERVISPAVGIHPSAVVDKTASIDPAASVGPYVVIAAGARLAAGAVVGPNCYVGVDCQIGEDTELRPNVVLCRDVVLGKRVLIHSGAVIGEDGFGFAHDGREFVKIAQLGGVSIGDDVEIGACTTVDRGALDDTVIEAGVKIDNLVQIAHNVRIGANTIICGCVGIAGSSTIGKNCTIAGGVGIANHIHVADGVTITGMTLVGQSVNRPGAYSSGTGLSDAATWRKNAVRFKQLDDMAKRLAKLEKKFGCDD
jgi:UDP-3-O-[3-hydroxymyristoyl] glucosamine N-acyltransferase